MSNFTERLDSSGFESDSRGRIYFFDNLKFWLIMLVVIGHFVNPVTGVSDVYKGLFMFIYTFHMPLFIFATGYFAKSIVDKTTGRFKLEKIIQFLILYLFLTLVIFFINYYLRGNASTYNFFQPVNPGWYLLASMIWYSLIPVINWVKPKYVMIGSVIIALLVGFDPMVGDFLTLSRAICFFPFFIAGYYMTQDMIQRILTWGGKTVRIAALVFIIVFLIFCLWDPINFYSMRKIVSPHYCYAEIRALGDLYNIWGPITRCLWYGAASFVSIAFMMIMSRKKTFYTELGKRTLQIYVWHAVAVRLLDYFGLFKLVETSNAWYIIALPIVISVGLTFIFAWKPLGMPFNWVLSNKFKSLFRRAES